MKTEANRKRSRSEQGFNSVDFFREIKRKLAEQLVDMTIEEQKDFLRQIRKGKIKIA